MYLPTVPSVLCGAQQCERNSLVSIILSAPQSFAMYSPHAESPLNVVKSFQTAQKSPRHGMFQTARSTGYIWAYRPYPSPCIAKPLAPLREYFPIGA